MAARTPMEALTGLRFIAAASIAIAHVTGSSHLTFFRIPLRLAALGMPLFFTLSGFVIHHVYSMEFSGSWRRAAIDFAIARISRLYPLFLFLMLYYVLFTKTGPLLLSGDGLLLPEL